MTKLVLKVILSLFFAALAVASYTMPMPLIAYNAKYPFIPPGVLDLLFTAYPYVNLVVIACIWFSQSAGKLVVFISSALFLSYHVKLYVSTDCAICAANGLIPMMEMSKQLVFFLLLLALSLTYFLLPNAKPTKLINREQTVL